MALITINGISIDPLAQAHLLTAVGLDAADTTQTSYILVQTTAPLTEPQKAELARVGVEIQEYVPDDTYLCHYPPSDLGPVRALPFVAWAGVYLKAFKIPLSLRGAQPAPGTAIVAAVNGRGPSRKPRTVDVVLHDSVDASSGRVREAVAAAARVDTVSVQPGAHKLRLTVEEGQLDGLAALDEVRHIEPVPERQLFNNVAHQILNADVLVNGTPYQGAGEVIAVADTGFDRGSSANVHPAFTGRVKRLYALGRTNPDKANDPHGHGTHVAGSALGDGQSKDMGGAIRGTAPRADLVLQSTLDSLGGLGGLPLDLRDLFRPPYENDSARVHTNSWGAIQPGLPYDESATEIDSFVWDHQDMVICFASGNDGRDANKNGVVDAGSIGSQSAAKNCITVGASEGHREFGHSYGEYWPGDFPVDPLRSDRQADDPDGMVAFSSRGPTKEGRFKPDVVAPGTCILSTRSRDATPSDVFGTSSDPLFFFDSGTSMATPLVAGCVAVLRECLIKNGTPKPSAALIKALLLNGAVELTGQYSPSEAGHSPNNNSGFGRVNLANSVIIPGPDPNGGFGDAGPLKQNEEDGFTIDIPKEPPRSPGSHPHTALGVTFKITLVWTDPPGPALQNDLDLIVLAADGQERHGNMGTSAKFDRANNAEQVLWTNMPPGPAKIKFRAFRITKFPQPYAYAWRIS